MAILLDAVLATTAAPTITEHLEVGEVHSTDDAVSPETFVMGTLHFTALSVQYSLFGSSGVRTGTLRLWEFVDDTRGSPGWTLGETIIIPDTTETSRTAASTKKVTFKNLYRSRMIAIQLEAIGGGSGITVSVWAQPIRP